MLTFAAAENSPAAQETAEKTAEELYKAGAEAADAGEYEKAKALFEQAAEKGSAGGLHGLGVEQNREKAVEYFRKAYESGDPTTLALLESMTEGGEITQDYRVNPAE